MIRIGLAGWGDHPSLYKEAGSARNKLAAYAKWFNAVEVDSTFYAVQSPDLMQRWANDTPPEFRFVVKAYQGMTGHARGGGSGYKPFPSEEAMSRLFGTLSFRFNKPASWQTCCFNTRHGSTVRVSMSI